MIVIGYGFLDEHINNIIAQNLKNQDFNLHIIGGSLSEIEQKAHYFQFIVDNFLKNQSMDILKEEDEINA